MDTDFSSELSLIPGFILVTDAARRVCNIHVFMCANFGISDASLFQKNNNKSLNLY